MSRREEGNIPTEVLQADEVLARVYRMGEIFQVFLYVLLGFFGTLGIIKIAYGVLDTALLIEVILFYLAVLFPIIVKIQSVRRYAFGFGLRMATIGGVIIIAVSEYGLHSMETRGILLATITILVFELYQHLIGIYPKRKAYLALIVGIAGLIFFGAMFIITYSLTTLPIALITSLIMTLLFVRAILPERKI